MLSPKSMRLAATSLGVVTLTTLGFLANAQLGGPSGIVLPYQGTLHQGADPVTGEVDLTFDVYNGATGGPICQSVSVPQTSVTTGAFAVELGLSDACVRGREVFFEISVNGVALPGRQKVHNALAATTSGTGDFHVTGNVVVGDGMQVTGEVGADSVDAVEVSAGDIFTDFLRSEGPVVVQTAGTNTGPIESNRSLVVTGTFDDGNAENGGVEFRHDNQTQGIGFGYNTIYATGSNASQDLNLEARGGGRITLNRDGQNTTVSASRNNNGSITSYQRSLQRLFIVAPYANRRYRNYVPLSEALMLEYCGDEDGCMVTMRMNNFSAIPADQVAASRGPYHFDYGDISNGDRRWRTSFGDRSGWDGNGAVNHIINEWDCYFTDGQYFGGNTSTNDNNRGLGFLNTGDTYSAQCELIIDD